MRIGRIYVTERGWFVEKDDGSLGPLFSTTESERKLFASAITCARTGAPSFVSRVNGNIDYFGRPFVVLEIAQRR